MDSGTFANVAEPIIFNGFAEYNQAIDDACCALDAIANHHRAAGNEQVLLGLEEVWAAIRSLREPKCGF